MSISATRPKVQIPVLSAIVRDVARDVNVIFYLLVIALTLLVLAVKTWGLVVLTMVALCMVPVMFALFIWISWP
jgi:hypothetical protein